MSSSVTSPSGNKNAKGERNNTLTSQSAKGKSKAAEEPMEEEEEEEDEGDVGSDEEVEEEEDDEEEDEFEEIDPSAIVGRRTRGVKVDYTSKEAIEKAGLKGDEDEDDDEDVVMKE